MNMHIRIFGFCGLAALLAGCQASRVTVDTADGQALPHAVLTAGASQATISRSITVPSGGTNKVAFVAFTNPDCTNFGYATVREVVPPEHGALDVKQTEGFGYWVEKNPRSQCNNKRVSGVLIQYRSKPGFTGIDHVTYEIFAPTTGLRRYDLTVNVL